MRINEQAATTYYNTWSSSKEGALDQTPWSMQDGDFLIVKDKSEEEKALSDAERAVLEKEQAARKKCVRFASRFFALFLSLFVVSS